MFHKFHHFTRIEPDWAYWDAPGVIFSGTKAGSVRAPGLLFFNYLLYSYYQEHAAYAEDPSGNQRLFAG